MRPSNVLTNCPPDIEHLSYISREFNIAEVKFNNYTQKPTTFKSQTDQYINVRALFSDLQLLAQTLSRNQNINIDLLTEMFYFVVPAPFGNQLTNVSPRQQCSYCRSCVKPAFRGPLTGLCHLIGVLALIWCPACNIFPCFFL